jgi:hypothetical protein
MVPQYGRRRYPPGRVYAEALHNPLLVDICEKPNDFNIEPQSTKQVH